MADEETLNVYDARAGDYAKLVTHDNQPDRNLQTFLDALPPTASLLDLGCGPGNSAKLMADAGHSVTATDASIEMVKLADQHDGVTAKHATFDDISGTALYDGIWANFSLLHATRDAIPRHLQTLSAALKPGGIFHIGMKTGTGSKRDGIGRLYTYVTKDELETLFAAVGLTPLSHRTGEEVGLDGVMAPWITMLARKP